MKPFVQNSRLKNWFLVLLVIGLTMIPLMIHPDSEFTGADGEAVTLVGEMEKGYQPWVKSLWKPPGGEVETLLFSLQAALGSAFIGYYFGYQRGRKKQSEKQKECCK